jgi:8-amino-7-oxononanoate synthase
MIVDGHLAAAPLTKDLTWPVDEYKREGLYFYLKATAGVSPNGRVEVDDYGEMIMLGSYSYLGLIGHPAITAAARTAIDEYGTGTHGVRLLAGSLPLHDELEERIARFKQTEAAITFSSGYVANSATIAGLLCKGDTVVSDSLNHASIVDGCLLARAHHTRFRHGHMGHLERRLQEARHSRPGSRILVVSDAVFSMDGDIAKLPEIHGLCRRYGAYLMIDEAHSIGVLGETGHGIEEHFGMPPDTVDVKMGTLSKAIPSAGGYVAGSHELITFLKHGARAFIFSAALPPASVAAARVAFDVIEEETWRVKRVQENARYFARRLRGAGFDLLNSETPILPVICGGVDPAVRLASFCQQRGIFVQAVAPPVVPAQLSRLRACVLAVHTREDLDYCAETIIEGGRALGIV